MSRVDLFTGIGLMGLSVGVYLLTQDMAKVPAGIGPGDYPRVAAAGLFLLGGILAVQALRAAPGTAPQPRYPRGAAPRVILLVLMIFAYIRVMPLLGFLLSTPLFLASAMLHFGVRRPLVIAANSLAVTGAVYAIFYSVFQILLPRFSLF